jgi:hypothetical protein
VGADDIPLLTDIRWPKRANRRIKLYHVGDDNHVLASRTSESLC